MKCEFCEMRDAEIRLVENRDGRQIFHNYCEVCAREMLSRQSHTKNSFTDLMTYLLESKDDFLVGPDDALMLKCVNCGYSYRDFIRTSRLGCPKCYNNFSVILDKKIKKIHGFNTHTGKVPQNFSSLAAINTYVSKNTLKNIDKQNFINSNNELNAIKGRSLIAYGMDNKKLVKKYDEILQKKVKEFNKKS